MAAQTPSLHTILVLYEIRLAIPFQCYDIAEYVSRRYYHSALVYRYRMAMGFRTARKILSILFMNLFSFCSWLTASSTSASYSEHSSFVEIFPDNILSHELAWWLKPVMVSRQNVGTQKSPGTPLVSCYRFVAQNALEQSRRVILV